MRKLFLLLALLSCFAIGCSSDTTEPATPTTPAASDTPADTAPAADDTAP